MLNFSKAFNKVPHLHLLHKLEFCSITGGTLTWLAEFLLDHSQQVALNGALSSCKVNSGLPQGYVLGPTLFLMYINGIADAWCAKPTTTICRWLYNNNIIQNNKLSWRSSNLTRTVMQVGKYLSGKWNLTYPSVTFYMSIIVAATV